MKSSRTITDTCCSALLDQALKIYSGLPHFAPERARANYKRGKLLKIIGRNGEGEANLHKAVELYRGICPGDQRPVDQLRGEDFDRRIHFWSRS
jgi:hypothetical protein